MHHTPSNRRQTHVGRVSRRRVPHGNSKGEARGHGSSTMPHGSTSHPEWRGKKRAETRSEQSTEVKSRRKSQGED